ncbi:DUF2059 domain-containing protein [Maribius pontilimi]|uniref:DUF2059 domain-containing protein n=1 Tax=Palleronia pontilimi TaxID=1964209 RepID=A0A934I9A7_9RHOB|nr:DUF2059 domain-containing protein [Palleronia pontilimi]MBJ3762849.1 DUF2059 domain-containing protein [Palleronia pontilimi]
MSTRYLVPLLLVLAPPALAAPSAATQALFDALRLGDVIAIMRQEGVEYGADLEAEMFPGDGGPAWAAAVDTIYDAAAMERGILDGLDTRLEDDDAEELADFFTSEPGQTIVDLEIEARRAMRDSDVEEAAEERAMQMRQDGSERMDLIEDFIAANGLIEQNIAGALNSNFAFYRGLDEGNAFEVPMTEDQMIMDVWAQEPEIRDDTEQWVYGYLTLAYQPLSDGDLEAYIALSQTDAGQALNDALFAAFDVVYSDISRQLGARAADFMQGEDI